MAQLSPYERRRAIEVMELLDGLAPETAAAIAPRLTAGLPAGAATAVQHATQRRVRQADALNQEWRDFADRQRVVQARSLDEFRKRILTQQQATARREKGYQAWLLWQQQFEAICRMSDGEAAQRFRSLMAHDRTWPYARQYLRAAMIRHSADAFFQKKREAALTNGTNPANAAAFDAAYAILSSSTMTSIIRETLLEARTTAPDQPQAVVTPVEKATTAREALEARLLAALATGATMMTPEQREAAQASVRTSLTTFFQRHGLDAGITASAAEIEALAEDLRGQVTSDLSDLLLDDGLRLDAAHYCAMVQSIESSINSLSTVPAHQREAAVDAMIEAHQRKMVGSGLDPQAVTAESVMAGAARSMYRAASRTMQSPERATTAEMEIAKAMVEIAQPKPALDAQPAEPSPAITGVLGRLHERRARVQDAVLSPDHEAPRLR